MSTEALEVADQADIGLDWDSDVEDFPSIDSQETNTESEDWTDEAVNSESVDKAKDSDSTDDGKTVDEEDQQSDSKVQQPKEEDSDGKQKAGDETGTETKVVDINDMPDDTIIKAKVDGEIQEISLKDYKNGISGERAIAKRFSEFDVKEKALQGELNEINAYVNEFASKMQSGDPVAALEYLAQFSGTPSYEVKDMLIKALLPEIERREELIPEQLEIEKGQAKLKFEQNKIETDSNNFKVKQAKQDLDFKVRDARQTHNISQEDWDVSFKHLDSSLPANEQITIDTVKEHILFTRAEVALQAVDANLLGDKSIMDSFVDIQIKNPDFNREDLLAIAQDAFAQTNQTKAKEELQDVIQSKKSATTAAVSPSKLKPEMDSSGSEIEDWDDIL